MNELVNGFPYVHIEIELNCFIAGNLPQHKTSMLRGILARIIRESVCHDFKMPCANCEFLNSCLYPAIFESSAKRISHNENLGTKHYLANPYILRCHDDNLSFHPEDKLRFEMIFMGYEADMYANVLINAIQEIDQRPFGKNQARFEVSHIRQVFQDPIQEVENEEIGMVELQYFKPRPIHDERLMLHFITPLKMQKDGQLLRAFSFNHFLWQVGHRVSQTTLIMDRDSFAVKQEDIDYPDEVYTVIRNDWKEYMRFSSRQLTPIKLSGMLATVEVKTRYIKEWLPLLQFAELFHVGKATTFGLGQFEIWVKTDINKRGK